MLHEHPPAPPPWGWPTTVIVATCFTVLAFDTGRLEGIPDQIWQVVYLIAAVSAIGWKATRRLVYIQVTCFLMFGSSFARAVSFILWQPERVAGVAINVLVCVFAALSLRSQSRWAR